jgi:hypothetical protein
MTDRSRWSAVTGQAVERHDKGRGYEIGENEFLVIEDHELEAAREQGEGGRLSLGSERPTSSLSLNSPLFLRRT